MKSLLNAFYCKCPSCYKSKMFINGGNPFRFKIPKMHEKCPNCQYKFERETGFFFGAMFVSYSLAAAQMITCLVVFWHFIDLSPLHVFLVIVGVAFLLSTFNFRLSRSIWTYLFYRDNSKS